MASASGQFRGTSLPTTMQSSTSQSIFWVIRESKWIWAPVPVMLDANLLKISGSCGIG